MSSKKRNKKQSSHKPKAHAVAGRRRPHRQSLPRLTVWAPPTATVPSEPVEPVRSDEPRVRPVLEPVTFTGEDPAAWAWLNTWPFLDETDVGTDEETEPEPLTDPPPTVNEETPVPSLTLFRTWSEEPVARTARRSRRVAGIAALVAAAVAVVGAMAWLAAGRGSEDRARTVHSDAYAAPVSLSPSTAFVRSRVLPSGDLEVTHWIHARYAVDSLTVQTPRTLGLDPGSVSVSHIVLATDGTPYPAVSIDKGHPGSQTFRFPLASVVYLSYRLSGAVQASGPGDRALARITSLDVTTNPETQRTTQSVVGARVLALACSAPTARALPQPCGVETNGSWQVALGRAEAHERVMAQLDLSPGGSQPVSNTR